MNSGLTSALLNLKSELSVWRESIVPPQFGTVGRCVLISVLEHVWLFTWIMTLLWSLIIVTLIVTLSWSLEKKFKNLSRHHTVYGWRGNLRVGYAFRLLKLHTESQTQDLLAVSSQGHDRSINTILTCFFIGEKSWQVMDGFPWILVQLSTFSWIPMTLITQNIFFFSYQLVIIFI